MTTLSETSRAYLLEIRALSTDSNGNEILVGLSVDETDFYLKFSELSTTNDLDISDEDRSRYLELSEKHEATRLSIIDGEIELREDKPSRH